MMPMTVHARSASLNNPEMIIDESSQGISLLEETQLLQVSLNDYVGSLAEHQSAFLLWLDELSRRPTEVDRYQYKKIR
jgi:hypothetical protein